MTGTERTQLARELFEVFTPAVGWDSFSWSMQERWRELAEHVAEKPCPGCVEKAKEIDDLETENVRLERRIEALESDLDSVSSDVEYSG